jgi:hypothetical protein
LSIVGKKGTPPSGPVKNTDVWKTVKQRQHKGSTYYKLGHLINEELHGPGNRKENITPISLHANQDHYNEVEKEVKNKVWNRENDTQGPLVHYEVEAIYGNENKSIVKKLLAKLDSSDTYASSDDVEKARQILEGEQYLATEFVNNAWTLNQTNGTFTPVNKFIDQKKIKSRVPNELPELDSKHRLKPVNLSIDDAVRITENTKLSIGEAKRLVRARERIEGKAFTFYGQLLEAGFDKETIDKNLIKNKFVSLRKK